MKCGSYDDCIRVLRETEKHGGRNVLLRRYANMLRGGAKGKKRKSMDHEDHEDGEEHEGKEGKDDDEIRKHRTEPVDKILQSYAHRGNLARGTYGSVSRAQDLKGKMWALKLIRFKKDQEDFMDREFQYTQRLASLGIGPALPVDTPSFYTASRSTPYFGIVTALYDSDGQSFVKALYQSKMTPGEKECLLVAYEKRVDAKLEAMIGAGIFCTDLKAANTLVNWKSLGTKKVSELVERLEVVLTDLGPEWCYDQHQFDNVDDASRFWCKVLMLLTFSAESSNWTYGNRPLFRDPLVELLETHIRPRQKDFSDFLHRFCDPHAFNAVSHPDMACVNFQHFFDHVSRNPQVDTSNEPKEPKEPKDASKIHEGVAYAIRYIDYIAGTST